LAASSSIAVQSKLADTSVYADKDRISQVLINLISNAIKFSPNNSAVNISTFLSDGAVEFRVTNGGAAIPAEEQASIFQPYHQSGSKESKRQGTGLGLTLSKMIVEAHEGAIGFTSSEESGTTFWFKLPARVDKPNDTKQGGVQAC
jgi:signal transduction histidine kinase